MLTMNSKRKIHQLYIHPKNELDIYNRNLGNGIIYFKDTLVHKVKIQVADFSNNYSELNFNLIQKGSPSCVANNLKFSKYSYSKDSNWRISLDSNSL